MHERIAFVGGGNMACAIIGGLLHQGFTAADIDVLEPQPQARARLQQQFGIQALEANSSRLQQANTVVWAVKPQSLRAAAQAARPYTHHALHLSVAAGIRSDSLAGWLDTPCIVRAMPNTPALIGKGISGLFARPAVQPAQRQQVERIMACTGEFLWLDNEALLDAVTALSGSGPAYMFYFMEAMITTGVELGLSQAQAHRLATATCVGAGELARSSSETPTVLRQQVTSKGGTTHAAIACMDDSHLQELFQQALHAAHRRAREMGDELGRD